MHARTTIRRVTPILVALAATWAATGSALGAELYAQSGTRTTHWTSQNFDGGIDPSFDNFDSEVADDFVVPAGQTWTVETVDVLGNDFFMPGDPHETPPSTVEVSIYPNTAGNLPGGPALATQTVASAPNDYTIPLSPHVELGFGAYWLSIRAVGGGPDDQWFWETSDSTFGRQVMFRNPGNGFATGVRASSRSRRASRAAQVTRSSRSRERVLPRRLPSRCSASRR